MRVFSPPFHLYQLWLWCSIREGLLPVPQSQIFYSVRYSLFLAGPPSNGPLQQDFFYSDFSHSNIFRGAKIVHKKFLKDICGFYLFFWPPKITEMQKLNYTFSNIAKELFVKCKNIAWLPPLPFIWFHKKAYYLFYSTINAVLSEFRLSYFKILQSFC